MLFAVPQKLESLEIEVTTACNLACAGCPRTLAGQGWQNRHMPIERFAKIIAHAPRADRIVFCGDGEPALNPDLEAMVEAAVGKVGAVGIATNGLAREPAFFAALRQKGLTQVSVSVAALDAATAAALREGTDVEVLENSIRELAQVFGGGLAVSLVLSRRNAPQMPGLLRRLYVLGVRTVSIEPMMRDSAGELCLDQRELEAAPEVLRGVLAGLPGLTVTLAAGMVPSSARCRRPYRAAYVTVDGLLAPCRASGDAAAWGSTSLVEHSFAQAWASPGVSPWLEHSFDAEPGICHHCPFNPSGMRRAKRRLSEGIAFFQAGKMDEAEEVFSSITQDHETADALHRHGLVRHVRGDNKTAVALLEAAYALLPEPRVGNNLAAALTKAGRRDEAKAILEKLVSGQSDYPHAWFQLAAMLKEDGEAQKAADLIGGLLERAAIAGASKHIRPALSALMTIDAEPRNVTMIGNLLRLAGRQDEVRPLLARRIARAPGDIAARLTHAMAHLAIVHQSEAEIDARRAAYAREIAEIETLTETAPQAQLADAAPAVGMAKPFFLSYQGKDDRDLQAAYGRVIHRISEAAAPSRPVAPKAGEKIRVGFVNSYPPLHSVSKTHGGWMKHLDRERFEVFGYHIAPENGDPQYASPEWRTGDKSWQAWRETIEADAPHVLIYLELGMQTIPLQMACRRIAPVQCSTWGHPITSGLPAVDYFLSSDLMEPENGEAHYTERLVRLPNLSTCYDAMPAQGGVLRRADLGLRETATVYTCCQSLYKYLPRYDDVCVRIAREVPDSQFVFLGAPDAFPTQVFRARMENAFRAAGLEPSRHLLIVPPVSFDNFPSFLRVGDVFLDSIEWSGCNTTLEALTCDRAVITLPAGLMRGRHTCAMLKMMGLDRAIAKDVDGYIALAARLADRSERENLQNEIAAKRHLLYGDKAPIRGLEKFLLEAVAQHCS